MSILIRLLTLQDIPTIVSAFADHHWPKPTATFERYLNEQQTGSRTAWVAFHGDQLADYGDAHKLYLARGYLPDGLGITHNYHTVSYGEKVPLDDDLILWFTKTINP